MYLLDTNIFLEILLKQDKTEACKKFIIENLPKIYISDFSLHSIGVILFRYNKRKIFNTFISEMLPHIEVLSLPIDSFKEFFEKEEKFDLDFDDYYQFSISTYYDLTIVTMDSDFRKIPQFRVKFI